MGWCFCLLISFCFSLCVIYTGGRPPFLHPITPREGRKAGEGCGGGVSGFVGRDGRPFPPLLVVKYKAPRCRGFEAALLVSFFFSYQIISSLFVCGGGVLAAGVVFVYEVKVGVGAITGGGGVAAAFNHSHINVFCLFGGSGGGGGVVWWCCLGVGGGGGGGGGVAVGVLPVTPPPVGRGRGGREEKEETQEHKNKNTNIN